MAKNSSGFGLVAVAVVFLVIGWFSHQYFGAQVAHVIEQISAAHQPVEESSNTHDDNATSGTMCAQVITPARNPETGDIKEFPTPCDVPKDWEVIQNDIPGL